MSLLKHRYKVTKDTSSLTLVTKEDTPKILGKGIIRDGKVFKEDGVTPYYKPNGFQYKDYEVTYDTSKDWIALYAEAIQNRCRRDLNLSDVNSITEAKRNLGLIGEVTDHYHDGRYYTETEIDSKVNEIKNSIKNIKLNIGGHLSSNTITLVSGTTNTLNVPTVNADTVSIVTAGANSIYNLLFTDRNASGNSRKVTMTTECSFNSSTSTFNTINANVSGSLAIGQNLSCKSLSVTGDITAGGIIKGAQVKNAIWNDYAEFMPRGEETEPGDIVMLDLKSDKEQYIKATDKIDTVVAGVHSDEFGILIGGEQPIDDTGYFDYNIGKYIPVALTGRVHVKFVGKAKKGAKVVPSSEPGYGRLYNKGVDDPDTIIGYLVEDDDKTDKRKLKIRITR